MTTLFIEQFKDINPTIIENILPYFEKQTLRKGEYLLNKGEVANKLYFLETGFVREYIYDENIQNQVVDFEQRILTNWIIGPETWFNQITSFITEKPSECYLQALSHVVCYSISKTGFMEMVEKFPVLNAQMHKFQEYYLLNLEQRNMLFRIKNLSKKLEYFEKLQPELANIIPQNIIASYLNITPSQLSKIRKERIKAKKM